MSIFQLATVLIYVTSVLTSTVNQSLEPDLSSPSALKKVLGLSPPETKDPTRLTDGRSVNNNESDAISKLQTIKSVSTEGGLVTNFHTEETKSSTTPDFLNAKIPEKIILESNESPKQSPIVPRKGVDEGKKTVGRKGVKFSTDVPDSEKSDTTDETIIPDEKILEPTRTLAEIPIHKEEQIPPAMEKTEVKDSRNDTKLEQSTDVIGNKNSTVTVIYVPSHPNDTTSHKRKPTWTTGEGDDDGKGMLSSRTQTEIEMPSSPTQTEVGMLRKVDYIVPVVITIMATPVLGIAAFILYTRGRDCWDKRHYSRMDFLVDGMYD